MLFHLSASGSDFDTKTCLTELNPSYPFYEPTCQTYQMSVEMVHLSQVAIHNPDGQHAHFRGTTHTDSEGETTFEVLPQTATGASSCSRVKCDSEGPDASSRSSLADRVWSSCVERVAKPDIV